MKIIFSRKGFDSSSGGFPSPILPDGRLISIPIPDKNSIIKYSDINYGNFNMGKLVESVTNHKVKSYYNAHLDPDLNENVLERNSNWKPILGQVGSSQGHLEKHNIGSGDLFLFFGLFQKAIIINNKIYLDRNFKPLHIIWGWLQIETLEKIDNLEKSKFKQYAYHPHFHRSKDSKNTIYIAKNNLLLPEFRQNIIPGAGIFPNFSSTLQLTADNNRTSLWKLPNWIYPNDRKSALTYHGNIDRYERKDGNVFLQTVGRGQEFILNCDHYPEAIKWVASLFKLNM